MNLDWILSPFTLYVLCAVCLGGSLLLWVSFKKELHIETYRTRKSYDHIQASLQELAASVEMVRHSRELAGPVLQASWLTAEINRDRRQAALQMCHQNEPAAAIAAAVHLPGNEIELLLKIDRLLDPVKPLADAGRSLNE